MKAAQTVEELGQEHVRLDAAAGAQAEDEIARAIGIVGDKGDAGRLLGQAADAVAGDAVGFQLLQQAVAKGVSADRSDGGRLQAEARRLRGEDEGRAAGVGPGEGAGLVQRLVDVLAHDLDQGFADCEDVEVHASLCTFSR